MSNRAKKNYLIDYRFFFLLFITILLMCVFLVHKIEQLKKIYFTFEANGYFIDIYIFLANIPTDIGT